MVWFRHYQIARSCLLFTADLPLPPPLPAVALATADGGRSSVELSLKLNLNDRVDSSRSDKFPNRQSRLRVPFCFY